jgi:hypothetical protein
MVKNTEMTAKEAYRAAVLEVIEFSAEDIVTTSEPTAIVPNEKGDNLSGDEGDYDWWN